MLLNTPHDFLEMVFSSAAVNLPAPGISRSITNFGMVISPDRRLDAALCSGNEFPVRLSQRLENGMKFF
jgi:hypothetical protein